MKGDMPKSTTAKAVVGVYKAILLRYPWLLTGALVGIVGMQIAALVTPIFLRNFFNLLTQGPTTHSVDELFSAASLVAGGWLAYWALNRLEHLSNLHLITNGMADALSEAYAYLMHHSYQFFISSFAGSLVHKLNKFARSYQTVYEAIALSFLPAFIFVVGAIVVLGSHNIVLGGILAAWVVIFIAFQVWSTNRRQPLRKVRSELDTKITATLADTISNQNTIALFSGAEIEIGKLKRIAQDWAKAGVRSWSSDAYVWSATDLLMVTIQVALLFGAILFWSRGLLTVGDFVLIQMYLIIIFGRLTSIQERLKGIFDALADAGEMLEILQTPHEIRDKRGAKRLAVGKGEVWFDDVSFNFHKDTPVLHQFNLTIAGGERVALVGPSGAGKSTVTKLLLRLYDVPQGRIMIDGQDVSRVTQDSLRDFIAFVPQEPILFHRSLMENIRYGRRDAADEEVMEAATKAHCHEFISKLPLGYETFVGERGIKLSGGERQRVAIARAILKDAPILILDEATSSLDSESEAYIQEALEILMKDKTVIVIAHRLSTIMKMDRIVVMEDGKIAAQGTHLELINQAGLYQKLWSIQAGGFLGDAV